MLVKIINFVRSLPGRNMKRRFLGKVVYSVLICTILSFTAMSSVGANTGGGEGASPQRDVNKMYLPYVAKLSPLVMVPINNGNFESGHAYWAEYSSNSWLLITTSSPVPAHEGSWHAWMGGDENEFALLYQTVTIWSDAPYLHYWYWSDSDDYCNYDFFNVYVDDDLIHTYTLCTNTNTYGWLPQVLNLSNYVGSGRTIFFEVVTDSSYNSNLFLDDIWMSNSSIPLEDMPAPSAIPTDPEAARKQ